MPSQARHELDNMESSSESDSPLWNDGADSSERGATGAPNRSSSACGALKRHKVSIVMTLVASVVFYLLGAGPAGRAALKLKLRGVRWGSQNMEDVTLMKMFFSKMKTPGTFVEMGALDGVIFSNSIAYEETYGWSGVLIEANPVSCEKLFKEPRRARSTKFCSAVCDDAKKRFLEFEFVDDPAVGGAVEALKTMDAEWKESWHSAGAAKKRSMVPCAPLSMLLRSTGVTAIDLFSLDVEGSEIHVLRTMDWSIPVHVWCIEVQAKDSETIGVLMRSKGYTRRMWPADYIEPKTWNQIWVDESYVSMDKGNTAQWKQSVPLDA